MAETPTSYVEMDAMKMVRAFLSDVIAGEADVRASYGDAGDGMIVREWQRRAEEIENVIVLQEAFPKG